MPDVDLVLIEQQPHEVLSLEVSPQSNIRVAITVHGFGITATAPIRASIESAGTGTIRASIAEPSIAAPTVPLAVHIGQGSVMVQWQHVDPATVERYELFGSDSLTGQYEKVQGGDFFQLHGMLHNVPLSSTIYLKVRAVGKNGAVSTFTQVKLGKFSPLDVWMRCKAIQGSTIPKDAQFSSVDQQTGQLIVIRAKDIISFVEEF